MSKARGLSAAAERDEDDGGGGEAGSGGGERTGHRGAGRARGVRKDGTSDPNRRLRRRGRSTRATRAHAQGQRTSWGRGFRSRCAVPPIRRSARAGTARHPTSTTTARVPSSPPAPPAPAPPASIAWHVARPSAEGATPAVAAALAAAALLAMQVLAALGKAREHCVEQPHLARAAHEPRELVCAPPHRLVAPHLGAQRAARSRSRVQRLNRVRVCAEFCAQKSEC